MRVLVIEDSVHLSEAIAKGLRKTGYAVDIVHDGPTGLWHATSHDYDVIVLDLMLPSMDGLTLLVKLRQAGRHSPVLVLTAKDTVNDRVRGLRTGADDYLTKPFAFDELLARIDALVRRHHVVRSPVIELRGLRIDMAARTVTRDGTLMNLPARQYALLEYLMLHLDTVVSRSEIESHLYDALAEPMSNVIDATVYALRKQIDRTGEPSFIQTRRGMGYIMPRSSQDGST